MLGSGLIGSGESVKAMHKSLFSLHNQSMIRVGEMDEGHEDYEYSRTSNGGEIDAYVRLEGPRLGSAWH